MAPDPLKGLVELIHSGTVEVEVRLRSSADVPQAHRATWARRANCSHRRGTWERQITFLKDVGVPAGFLPDGAELDLQFPAGQPATVAERR